MRTKTRITRFVAERILLLVQTSTAPWFLCVLSLILTAFNIVLNLVGDVPILYELWIPATVLTWCCLREYQRYKGQFGGRGLFEVLRNKRQHDLHMERVLWEQRRKKQTRAVKPPVDRVKWTKDVLVVAQEAMKRYPAEVRANKVIKKALGADDPLRFLMIIVDNKEYEPNGARIAQNAITHIRRV